jgi:hypothetical protein
VNGDDDAILERFRERTDVDWVPYHKRRSTGTLLFRDEGDTVQARIEIAGLGYVVLTGRVKGEYWDESAAVTMRLEE